MKTMYVGFAVAAASLVPPAALANAAAHHPKRDPQVIKQTADGGSCPPGSAAAAYCVSPSIDGHEVTGQANTSATARVSTSVAGDLLVAFVRSDSPDSAGNTSTVSGGGLRWRRVARENRALGDAEVWVARATSRLSGAAITATATRYSNFDEVLTVIAFENAPGIGAHATSFSHDGAPIASLKTTRPDSWVFAAGDDWLASIDRTPGPGQTIQQESTDSAGDTYWVQSTSLPTPNAGTTVTINDTAPKTDPYDLVLVEVL